MRMINEDEMAKKLKAPITDNIWMILGDDDYLKEYYCSRLVSACVSDELQLFNYHVFNDDDSSLEDIFAAANNLPVMSEKTCLLIRNYPLNELGEKQLEAFRQSLRNIPDTTVMIFYHNTQTLFDGKYIVSKWASAVNCIAEKGIIVNLTHRSQNKTVKMLVSKAPSRGTTIGEQEARYLLETVGDDMQTLFNEFNKVCSYSCGKPVTVQMIDEIAVRSVEANVFDISTSLFSGNTDKAFAITNELLRVKTPVQMIIGSMATAFVNMYRYKAAAAAGRSIDELAEPFAYKDSYVYTFRSLARFASDISDGNLRECIAVLSETDVQTKSTAFEPSALMTELIARLAALCKKR